MPGFSRGKVAPIEAARAVPPGQVNRALVSLLKKVQDDVEDLHTRVGVQAIDFNRRTPVADPPQHAKFSVQPVNGTFTVAITNPQDVPRSGVQRARRQQNPLRTTILHRVALSLTPAFDADGDVRYYGPSTQTHWPIVDIGISLRYVGLESSYDGTNWNKRTVSGPFQS